MKIQENYSLKNLNTFGVDVSAKYFAEVKDINDLKYAIEFAKINHFEMLFLGGGSNVFFTKDFGGLVIKLDLKGISE